MADISLVVLGVCLVLTSVVPCQAMRSFNLDVLLDSQFIPDQCFHNNFCVVLLCRPSVSSQVFSFSSSGTPKTLILFRLDWFSRYSTLFSSASKFLFMSLFIPSI